MKNTILLLIGLLGVQLVVGGNAEFLFAQGQDRVATETVTTYFPSPNIVAQDFNVTNSLNVNNITVSNGGFFAIDNTADAFIPASFYIDDDGVNINRGVYVDDTINYDCSRDPCGKYMDVGDLKLGAFGSTPSSVELSGVALEDWPRRVSIPPLLGGIVSALDWWFTLDEPSWVLIGFDFVQEVCFRSATPGACIETARGLAKIAFESLTMKIGDYHYSKKVMLRGFARTGYAVLGIGVGIGEDNVGVGVTASFDVPGTELIVPDYVTWEYKVSE